MAELKEGQNLQDEIVAAVDTGARAPIGWEAKFIATTTFVWALFQLYIASNLPFWLTDVTGISLVVTNSNARLIHLAFGLFLAALAFPLFKKSSKTKEFENLDTLVRLVTGYYGCGLLSLYRRVTQ
jgi:TRAP-type uncharacterized transport system fused permease subunit